MLTADLYQLRDPISDLSRLPYQQKAPSAWYAPDTSTASGSLTVPISDIFIIEPALTQPLVEFDEEMTRLSFKVSSQPVGQALIEELFDEVFTRPTVPFYRVLEEDLGE